MSSVVADVLQRKVYGGVPPPVVRSTAPFAWPAQVSGVTVADSVRIGTNDAAMVWGARTFWNA